MVSGSLLSIGVNTGNSLDAADVVLTKFEPDGSIVDLDALSAPMPEGLANCLRLLRAAVVDCSGDMQAALKCYERRVVDTTLTVRSAAELIKEYTLYVARAVKELIEHAELKSGRKLRIDLIGFHGQTCAHQPPSIAKDAKASYTVQIGDGQLLANETGITVVFDFRSDDLMNGGEAAPLAPIHHEHLAQHLKSQGKFPIAFCNAGNTGNISVITGHTEGSVTVMGWDVGPFNDYPDKLVQSERNSACDFAGAIGAQGKVNNDLLQLLFDKGAVTENGTNYLLQAPPKSSDPQWYRLLPELCGKAAVGTGLLSFEDRIRTAEYFAAYVYYYSLKWIPPELMIPTCFALCGGGWNNPVSRTHFEQLLRGDFTNNPVLPEHRELFVQIFERLQGAAGDSIEIAMSDEFGFSGQYMEARLFADAAVCRVTGNSFSYPKTSGCRTPTVLGIIRYPHGKPELASENLQRYLTQYRSAELTLDEPHIFDGRWSRASRDWHIRIAQVAKR